MRNSKALRASSFAGCWDIHCLAESTVYAWLAQSIHGMRSGSDASTAAASGSASSGSGNASSIVATGIGIRDGHGWVIQLGTASINGGELPRRSTVENYADDQPWRITLLRIGRGS